MLRTLAAVSLALFSGCATEPDTRPETAAYIIDAILVPYCGRGGCHDTGTKDGNVAFDTIPAATAALSGSSKRGKLVMPGDSAGSQLYKMLTTSQRTMPPDVPLPDLDIELIKRWIDDGASGL